VQCPGDLNGDADWDDPGEVQPPGVRCIHLAAADGFINMGDDQHKLQYTFGFSDQSSKSEDQRCPTASWRRISPRRRSM
jgi:hypothetical protein